MSHEIGQPDISDRQLMTKSKASDWTEIGEAKITHSIFGKAEVRIVRKYDAPRRALSLVLLLSLLVVAAWLGWVGYQQNYPAPSADLSSPLSAKDEVTTPAALINPPMPTAAATPRTVRIAASSPAATDSPNKVDATHLPVDNSQ